MNTSGTLSAVLFDMDGCLVDTEQAYIRAWQHAFESKGIPMDSTEIRSWAGEGKAVINNRIAELLGSRETAMELRQIREDYFYVLLDQNQVQIKPYAMEILKFIKECGLRTALASSTFEDRGSVILKHFHLDDYLDVVTWGNEVTISKPDPEIYLKSLEKLRAEKNRCVVFEDSYNGVTAAKAAGLRVIHIPDTSVMQVRKIPPVYKTISNFKEGIEIIRRLTCCGD